MSIMARGKIMRYILIVAIVAILASVATYVYADGRMTFKTSEYLNHKTQDFLFANGNECRGLQYLPGAYDGNFGTWIVTTVDNPVYTYMNGNHFNPIQECEAN